MHGIKPTVSPPGILLFYSVSSCTTEHVPKFACGLLYNVHVVRLAVSPTMQKM